MPRVSVVIPAFNAERYIREALDSVMAQTWRDLEVVVVDDGSTDGTREIVAGYGEAVRLVEQANAGPSAARNRGVREARGELVAFIDADDLWLPGKLALQLPLFDGEGRVALVYSRAEYMDDAGRPLPTQQLAKPSGRVYWRLLEGNCVPTSSVVVRRGCFERAGGFATDMIWAEDWYLWVRVAREWEFGFVDRVLVRHRSHGSALSAQRGKAYLGALDALARAARDDRRPRTRRIARRTRRRLHRTQGLRMADADDWASARRPLLQALARWPFDPKAFAALALSLLPARLRRGLVRRWRARGAADAREEAAHG